MNFFEGQRVKIVTKFNHCCRAKLGTVEKTFSEDQTGSIEKIQVRVDGADHFHLYGTEALRRVICCSMDFISETGPYLRSCDYHLMWQAHAIELIRRLWGQS